MIEQNSKWKFSKSGTLDLKLVVSTIKKNHYLKIRNEGYIMIHLKKNAIFNFS